MSAVAFVALVVACVVASVIAYFEGYGRAVRDRSSRDLARSLADLNAAIERSRRAWDE